MALERSNLASLPVLFEILRPQELELLNLKKGRKKNDRYSSLLLPLYKKEKRIKFIFTK